MANNEIKPFATGANANVTPQAEWENLPALLTGFSSGKASSAQVNKAIRQASFVAATLAQFIADQSGEDVRDDGDQAGLVAKMLSAINKTSQPLDETLVALAALATGANKLPYFTGNDTAAVTDLTAIGRNIIGKGSIADVLSYLGLGDVANALVKTKNLSDLPDKQLARKNIGLGTAATRDVGTGADQIPDRSAFANDSGASGWYQKLPSGIIIQGGNWDIPSQNASVALPLPLAFQSVALWAICNFNGPVGSSPDNAYVQSLSLTGIRLTHNGDSASGATSYWMAIGI